MRAVLIPVKDLTRAKQRLAAMLSQAARTALATAMMEDVFSAVAAARGLDAVFVVSNYGPALERARSLGWSMIRERRQISESDSVDRASRRCVANGVTSLLRLPIDIPLMQPADVEAVLTAAGRAPATVLIPSRDGTGTNALLRTPPALFPSHFGPLSLRKHLAEAQKKCAGICVLRNPRIELDVDDEDDLRVLAAEANLRGATCQWLRRAGIHGPNSRAISAD
ncbi:MAG TPA: 2-phospho-L-lactate guanylyltransferase [Candidatus Acidoferrales bacterium]|jgi:2-phospho-L-lactate guanylyltransferase|nr:2-phospho-L-lactate guanylyltransferase [Candidatus Acidoferrales bacterium]